MSSLRLALKQSLEEANPTIRHEQQRHHNQQQNQNQQQNEHQQQHKKKKRQKRQKRISKHEGDSTSSFLGGSGDAYGGGNKIEKHGRQKLKLKQKQRQKQRLKQKRKQRQQQKQYTDGYGGEDDLDMDDAMEDDDGGGGGRRGERIIRSGRKKKRKSKSRDEEEQNETTTGEQYAADMNTGNTHATNVNASGSAAAASTNVGAEEDANDFPIANVTPLKVKRGRGRPKGSTNKNSKKREKSKINKPKLKRDKTTPKLKDQGNNDDSNDPINDGMNKKKNQEEGEGGDHNHLNQMKQKSRTKDKEKKKKKKLKYVSNEISAHFMDEQGQLHEQEQRQGNIKKKLKTGIRKKKLIKSVEGIFLSSSSSAEQKEQEQTNEHKTIVDTEWNDESKTMTKSTIASEKKKKKKNIKKTKEKIKLSLSSHSSPPSSTIQQKTSIGLQSSSILDIAKDQAVENSLVDSQVQSQPSLQLETQQSIRSTTPPPPSTSIFTNNNINTQIPEKPQLQQQIKIRTTKTGNKIIKLNVKSKPRNQILSTIATSSSSSPPTTLLSSNIIQNQKNEKTYASNENPIGRDSFDLVATYRNNESGRDREHERQHRNDDLHISTNQRSPLYTPTNTPAPVSTAANTNKKLFTSLDSESDQSSSDSSGSDSDSSSSSSSSSSSDSDSDDSSSSSSESSSDSELDSDSDASSTTFSSSSSSTSTHGSSSSGSTSSSSSSGEDSDSESSIASSASPSPSVQDKKNKRLQRHELHHFKVIASTGATSSKGDDYDNENEEDDIKMDGVFDSERSSDEEDNSNHDQNERQSVLPLLSSSTEQDMKKKTRKKQHHIQPYSDNFSKTLPEGGDVDDQHKIQEGEQQLLKRKQSSNDNESLENELFDDNSVHSALSVDETPSNIPHRKRKQPGEDETSQEHQVTGNNIQPPPGKKKKMSTTSSQSSLSRHSHGSNKSRQKKQLLLSSSTARSISTISKGSTIANSHSSKKKKKKDKKKRSVQEKDGYDDDKSTGIATNNTFSTVSLTADRMGKHLKKKRKQRSVIPPTKEVLAWVIGMPQTKQRSEIAAGMRVKVRFTKPKLKWYGGCVARVNPTGSKIRILYDDGTKEVTDFPDKEIIVDDSGNGRHEVSAKSFQPKEHLFGKSIPMSVPTKKMVRKGGNIGVNDQGVDNSGILVNSSLQLHHQPKSMNNKSTIDKELSMLLGDSMIHVDDDAEKIGEHQKRTEKNYTDSTNIEAEQEISDNKKKVICNEDTISSFEGSQETVYNNVGDQTSVTIHENKTKSDSEDTSKPKLIISRSSTERHVHRQKTEETIESKREEKIGFQENQASEKQSVDSTTSSKMLAITPLTPSSADVMLEISNEAKNPNNGSNAMNDSITEIASKNDFMPTFSEEHQKSSKKGISDTKAQKSHNEISQKNLLSNSSDSELQKSNTTLLVSNEERSERNNALDTVQEKTIEHSVKNEPNTSDSVDNRRSVPQSSDKSQKTLSSTSEEADKHIFPKQITNQNLGGRRPKISNRRVTLNEEVDENQKQLTKRRRRDKSEDGKRRKKKIDDDDNFDNDIWVKCDKCDKWRLIPSDDNLPEKWYCELNVTDLSRNTCEAPEQTQEEVAKQRRKNRKRTAAHSSKGPKRPKSQSPMTVPKRSNDENTNALKADRIKSHRSCPIIQKTLSEPTKSLDSGDEYIPNDENSQRSQSRRPKVSDEETRGRGGEVEGNGDSFSGNKLRSNKRSRQSRDDDGKGKKKGRKPKETKQQEWVQCDKCEKWRRLPTRISAEDLPDIWYCSMNTWDPRSASCAVQDDLKAVEETNAREGIMNVTQKTNSGSKLTYRDLIRKPTRPISEKMRAAESIFSSHAGEQDGESLGPPVVTYFNSSAFQQRIGFNRINASEKNVESTRLTLFELMSHSRLWKDLSLGFCSELPLSNVIEKDQETRVIEMKAMVHYALSHGPMAADEVLFECQTGDWEGMPWTTLRASCTIDSVMSSLTELEDDGLIEKVTLSSLPPNSLNMATICYRLTEIEGIADSLIPKLASSASSTSNESCTQSIDSLQNSKISKPLKKRLLS